MMAYSYDKSKAAEGCRDFFFILSTLYCTSNSLAKGGQTYNEKLRQQRVA